MSKKPRILFFDIETSPNLAYVWGKWEQNVLSFKKEWELLSFAWKWQGNENVGCRARCDYDTKSEAPLVRALWDLIDQADVIVAHNGDAFDIKKASAKFVEHGLLPPTPYKTIDTKKMAKASFNFNSNSLNDLGTTLKLGKKHSTGGFDLWLDCMAGKPAAWAKMKAYNKQDVVLLEKVYDKLKVWDQRHISLAAMSDKSGVCPLCSSPKVQSRGYNYTRASKRPRLHCLSCGHWSQGSARAIK